MEKMAASAAPQAKTRKPETTVSLGFQEPSRAPEIPETTVKSVQPNSVVLKFETDSAE